LILLNIYVTKSRFEEVADKRAFYRAGFTFVEPHINKGSSPLLGKFLVHAVRQAIIIGFAVDNKGIMITVIENHITVAVDEICRFLLH